jgi:biotin carboxyl carrier protein
MSKQEKHSAENTPGESKLENLEIGNALYVTRLTSKFKQRKNWERPNLRMVMAVIPGTIQKIMVKEGEKVEAGTPILILEAMKMRNEVLAPIDGVVRSIHVKEGEQVPKSHLLVELH